MHGSLEASAANAALDRVAERMARQFLPGASDLRLRPLGHGLINETRLVETDSGRFVLQRINRVVFQDPDAILGNLLRVQDWLREHEAQAVRLPRLVCAPDGAPMLRDGEGDAGSDAWRLMEYIEDSRTLRPLKHPAQAAEIGRVLGEFHLALAGLDPGQMSLTLPGLHDTPGYLRRLEAVLEGLADASRDAGEALDPLTAARRRDDPLVIEAVEQIRAHAELIPVLQQAREAGRLRPQVTHGDPKLDNVLFARDADRALCLIDLDTVQPGLLHEDLADCVRSCCNRPGGAEAGFGAGFGASSGADFDLAFFEALLGGYARVAAPLFDADAIALVYPAIRLIPLELAIRFLTDHLEGNRYFRVSHPRQNLEKTLIQLALVQAIERERAPIERMIRNRFAPGAGEP